MSSLLHMSFSIPIPPQHLSFSKTLSSSNPLFLHTKFSYLSLHGPKTTVIRMGGGPRTYPGGVSKWQWKRMQAKKAKQLLKARLCRERQIYEMRKRAELKAAVSELERPWEVVERAPNLFSVRADEQVKVLADRFQRPGGFDLWSENDGPQLFETVDGLPSARFFPKGVVHSVKPYGRVGMEGGLVLEGEECGEEMVVQSNGFKSNGRSFGRKLRRGGSNSEGESDNVDSLARGDSSDLESSYAKNYGELSSINKRTEKKNSGKLRKNGNRRRFGSANSSLPSGLDSGQVGFDRRQRGESLLSCNGDGRLSGSKGLQKMSISRSEVYDMRLEQDGSYKFQQRNGLSDSSSGAREAV